MRRIVSLIILGVLILASPGVADIIVSTRKIDWTANTGIYAVGVSGGITVRTTICSNISSSLGNDSSDAYPAIQAAINACPSGQVVKLPNGTFRLNTGRLQMKSGVTLRGNGPENTRIHGYYAITGYNQGVVDITGSASWGSGINMVSGYTKGSNTVTLASGGGSSISVGDYISIDQLNDSYVYFNNSCGATCGNRGATGARARGQLAQVTAKNGDTITFTPPLMFTYNAAMDPEVDQLASSAGFKTGVGVEDVYIDDKVTSPANRSPVVFLYAADSWLKNVWVDQADDQDRVQIWAGFRLEIRDSRFGPNKHSNTNTHHYDISMFNFTTSALIENNIMENASGHLTIQSQAGSVFAYNYFPPVPSSDLVGEDIAPFGIFYHGAYSHFNLDEGNIGPRVAFDDYWGNSGWNTTLRSNWNSYRSPAYPYSNWPIDLYRQSYGVNTIGSVLGNSSYSWASYEANGSGCNGSSGNIYRYDYPWNNCTSWADYGSRADSLRHGNYDYYTNSIHWCDGAGEPGCQGGDASHTIPTSYYRSAKPSWWCSETPWPPIGSDLSPMVSKIPAQRRSEGLPCTVGVTPLSPTVVFIE